MKKKMEAMIKKKLALVKSEAKKAKLTKRHAISKLAKDLKATKSLANAKISAEKKKAMVQLAKAQSEASAKKHAIESSKKLVTKLQKANALAAQKISRRNNALIKAGAKKINVIKQAIKG